MEHAAPAYSLWTLAIINSLMFMTRRVFGAEWDCYAARTPRWIPRFGAPSTTGAHS